MFKLSEVSIRWENVTDSRTSTLEVQFCYHLCDNFDSNKIYNYSVINFVLIIP